MFTYNEFDVSMKKKKKGIVFRFKVGVVADIEVCMKKRRRDIVVRRGGVHTNVCIFVIFIILF